MFYRYDEETDMLFTCEQGEQIIYNETYVVEQSDRKVAVYKSDENCILHFERFMLRGAYEMLAKI